MCIIIKFSNKVPPIYSELFSIEFGKNFLIYAIFIRFRSNFKGKHKKGRIKVNRLEFVVFDSVCIHTKNKIK